MPHLPIASSTSVRVPTSRSSRRYFDVLAAPGAWSSPAGRRARRPIPGTCSTLPLVSFFSGSVLGVNFPDRGGGRAGRRKRKSLYHPGEHARCFLRGGEGEERVAPFDHRTISGDLETAGTESRRKFPAYEGAVIFTVDRREVRSAERDQARPGKCFAQCPSRKNPAAIIVRASEIADKSPRHVLRTGHARVDEKHYRRGDNRLLSRGEERAA